MRLGKAEIFIEMRERLRKIRAKQAARDLVDGIFVTQEFTSSPILDILRDNKNEKTPEDNFSEKGVRAQLLLICIAYPSNRVIASVAA